MAASQVETLRVREEGAVLFAQIAAPPMNLIGPELVRALVALIQRAEADDAIRVIVFTTLEVMLSADDYHADLAERYGWINRALPADELVGFVKTLAHRIAAFPAAGQAVVKERVNAIALAPADDFRRDSDLFLEGVSASEVQHRIQAALQRGFQARDEELALGRRVADWAREAS